MGVPLALRNLLYERGKLLLSVVGIAAALALILLLTGFRDGMYDALTAYYRHLPADLVVAQSTYSLSGSTIPNTLHDRLVEISGAVEADHAIVAGIIFNDNEFKMAVALVGYNPATGVGGPWNLASGRQVQAEDEVVIDVQLAKESGLTLGAEVKILGRPFTIVGLSRETSSWIGYYTFVSRAAAETLLGMSGSTSFYALRLPPGRDPARVASALEAQIEGVKSAPPSTFAANARRSVGSVLDSSINALLGIAIIVGIAIMGLTVYTAVVSRMREYGALKAIGSNNRHMAWLVLREALYRAALGFILGAGLSYLIAWALSSILPRWNVLISPVSLVSLGAAALGMTLAAIIFPLRRISRLDPAIVFKA